METRPGEARLHPAWWTAILIAVIAAMVLGTAVAYSGSLNSYVPVTVTSERSGLGMEPGAKVMLNGVQVGRVSGVAARGGSSELKVDIDADQAHLIPANAGAQIRATTVFGAKYV